MHFNYRGVQNKILLLINIYRFEKKRVPLYHTEICLGDSFTNKTSKCRSYFYNIFNNVNVNISINIVMSIDVKYTNIKVFKP